MPFTTTTDTRLHYTDTRTEGRPVVLVHGWPLSQRMWEPQVQDLADAGFRVITYDRRGFGDSDAPWTGYDYDAFARDLAGLIDELALEDVTLVGFSMGGGEVARYLGTFGSDKVSKAVLVSAVTPYLLATDEDPEGVDREVFVDMLAGVRDDRLAFLDGFGRDFLNWSEEEPTVSAELLRYLWTVAATASPRATRESILAFAETDFRGDLKNVDVPTLVVHGTDDRIVPFEVSGKRVADYVEHARTETFDGAPHGLTLTHRDAFNALLIEFLDA